MTGETSNAALERAAEFIWSNARLLERRLFALRFTGGEAGAVLAALRPYQNADGGFGNALEPDKRCPNSQPVDVETALHVMEDAGPDAEMLRRACDFLATITTGEGGVPFVLPSANAYPGQPWWRAEADPPASLNPTAAIAGLMLRFGVRHPWLERATDYCWRAIERSDSAEPHELLCILTFLENAPDRARAERELERVGARILDAGLVALDPHAEGYVKKPLDWAPTPERWCRRLFDDATIAAHLDALAGYQQADGGWGISWQALSPGSEVEWRGMVTYQALKTLQAYGRL